jgi:hypothetical protein
MAETVRQLVRDLREEQLVLDHLVAALDPADWLRPTLPRAGTCAIPLST